MSSSSNAGRKRSRSESETLHAPDGASDKGRNKRPRDESRTSLSSTLDMDENKEIVITGIRATDVALGLRRVPAGFYVVVHHSGLEWRTDVKSSSVNRDVVEWTELVPLPSALSAPVRLEIYASFEFQPKLGAGEQLRKLTVTVEQLMNRSAKDIPFTFFPKVEDVVSPCSSILVTVERRKSESRDSSTPRVLDPRCSTTETQGELEHITNQGHHALSRYRKHGEKRDLERSIQEFERAFSICALDNPCRAAAQSNLAMAKFILCQVEDMDASLWIPLDLYRNTLAVRPVGHVDRPSTLIQLATVHLALSRKLKDGAECAHAEALLREAVALCSAERHENRAATLMLQLCAGRGMDPGKQGGQHSMKQDRASRRAADPHALYGELLGHFDRFGDLALLELVIAGLKESVESTSIWDNQYSWSLQDLGAAMFYRFKHLGKLSDLEDAISKLRDAVNLTPHSHPDKPVCLNNLGTFLEVRFERLGELDDLEDSISILKDAVDITPHYHPNKPKCLSNLGLSFIARFKRHGELSDLDSAILTLKDTVDLTPHGDPHKPVCLNNLGVSLETRFKYLGELSNLEDAILTLRVAVNLTPRCHPHKPSQLTNLGDCLLTRFRHLGELSDLEDAISMLKDAVKLVPHGNHHKPAGLNNLGNCFRTRFHSLGELNDIEDAISTLRDAVELTPHGHPDRSNTLMNLGISFITRFWRFGELSDLEDAISTVSDAVKLTPHGHPKKPRSLNALGNCLMTRFKRFGGLSDLEDAILMFRDAVNLTSRGHPEKPSYLENLGDCFTIRFDCFRDPGDIEAAISLYRHVASSPFGPIDVRFHASQKWVSHAHRIRHHSLLHAYSITISLLPRLAWIGLPLLQRYTALTWGADVVREAAAAALDAGLPELAVEWLEQGRSIVWGELFQLRNSYEELSSAHPDHACRLRDLSSALEHASTTREKSLSALSEWTHGGADHTRELLEQEADRHRKLAIERDKLLQEIRRLPGFEGFLLRKQFPQLRVSAHAGPVVMLNAAKSRCDALTILPGVDHVIHIPLPNFTFKRSAELQNIMKGLLGRHFDEREGNTVTREGVNWQSFLSPLWKCVVKPVLDALAFSSPGDLTRTFWCPTGPFAFLPIHAAGFYDTKHSQPGHKVYDFVVSSYVPTLAVLAPSLNPDITPSQDLRLLAVCQPPSDGLSRLPGVETELKHIKEVVRNSSSARTTYLQSSSGTVEEVLVLMKKADWVHFACHGVQDGVNSGLCLADGRRLKLHDIIGLSRPRGGLAFLSACQTAKGEERLSDEAIHIAAGMLFAGYGGVIATMWSISDKLAPDIARDVYEQLFQNGTRPDHREAARALHDATGRLRKRGVRFDEWLPFIHVGL